MSNKVRVPRKVQTTRIMTDLYEMRTGQNKIRREKRKLKALVDKLIKAGVVLPDNEKFTYKKLEREYEAWIAQQKAKEEAKKKEAENAEREA
jgi:hypothetical protein